MDGKRYGLHVSALIGTIKNQAFIVFFDCFTTSPKEKIVPGFVPVRRTGTGYPLLMHFLTLHAFFRVHPADIGYVTVKEDQTDHLFHLPAVRRRPAGTRNWGR
jgi:hypothetical protein